MSMQCIFCLQEREPSVEHVYPDAIGGTLIIDRVCKPCNDWLGTNVDVLLTDHVAILAKRNQLGIPNRSGKAPTWHDVFGLGAMANDPNQRVKIVEDAKTGKIKPTFLHKEVRTKPDNGAAGINVTIDASQVAAIGKIIERTRKREGLPPLSEAALHEQIEAAGAEIGTIEHPEVIHKLAFDLWHYQRAICKIIYELAWALARRRLFGRSHRSQIKKRHSSRNGRRNPRPNSARREHNASRGSNEANTEIAR